MENENEIHSKFLLNETTKSLSLPITTRARVTHSGIVDVKLKQFFDFEKRRIKFIEFVRNIAIFVQ